MENIKFHKKVSKKDAFFKNNAPLCCFNVKGHGCVKDMLKN